MIDFPEANVTDIATKPAVLREQKALIGTWRRCGAAGPV
jgi:hypothetical protein